jgi:hypothetical protein
MPAHPMNVDGIALRTDADHVIACSSERSAERAGAPCTCGQPPPILRCQRAPAHNAHRANARARAPFRRSLCSEDRSRGARRRTRDAPRRHLPALPMRAACSRDAYDWTSTPCDSRDSAVSRARRASCSTCRTRRAHGSSFLPRPRCSPEVHPRYERKSQTLAAITPSRRRHRRCRLPCPRRRGRSA